MDWMRILFFGNAQLTYTDTSLCVAAGFAGKNTRGNTFRLNLNTNIIQEILLDDTEMRVCERRYETTWGGRRKERNYQYERFHSSIKVLVYLK